MFKVRFRRAPVAVILLATLCASAAPAQTPAAEKAAPPAAKPSESKAAPHPAERAVPPVETAAEPAKAASGALILTLDADAVSADVAGQAASLKKGANRLALPAGPVAYSIVFEGGLTVKGDAVVPAGGDATAFVYSRGTITVTAGEDAKVEIDGKPVSGGAGKYTGDAALGSHSVVVSRTGYSGRKGNVDVVAGKTTEVEANLEKFEPVVDNTLAWTTMTVGGLLFVSAILIDNFKKYDQFGGDTAKWAMFGVGAAGFVGGTIMLKHNMDAAGVAPVKDGGFGIKVTGVQGGAVATLGLRF